MKYCSHCGAEVNDDAVVCVKCGRQIAPEGGAGANPDDKMSWGFAILSFFFPLVGLILFLVWRKETPIKAKGCGMGALIGFILNVVVTIIFTCVGAAAYGAGLYY